MATKDKQRPKTASSRSSQQARMLVLLEKIEQQNSATIDAVFSAERRVREDLGKRIDDLTLRVEALEIAVRKNSEDIRKNSEDIRKNSEDIERLRIQVERLNSILEADQAQNVIQRLELRIRRVEERLGLLRPRSIAARQNNAHAASFRDEFD